MLVVFFVLERERLPLAGVRICACPLAGIRVPWNSPPGISLSFHGSGVCRRKRRFWVLSWPWWFAVMPAALRRW